MTSFIYEGTKILIRFQYAILKVHKDYLKNLKDSASFEEKFNEYTTAHTKWEDIQTHAYKYFLTTEKLHFIDSEEHKSKEETKEYETVEDFLPPGVVFPSKIINLEQLY